jgi:hypothetical protein
MFFRTSLRQAVFTMLTSALVLTACNMGAPPVPTVDVNAINTAAVETAMGQLSAQFTQTALAAPSATPTNTAVPLPSLALTAVGVGSPAATTSGALPTVSFNSTPLAGFTPLSSPAPAGPTVSLGDACNNNVFEGDVTIPDGTIMRPGEDFIKTWAIRNTGNCTWDEGYVLVFIGGNRELDPVNFEFKRSDDFVAAGEAVNVSVPLTAPLTPGSYTGTWRMQSDTGYYFGTPLTVVIEVRR